MFVFICKSTINWYKLVSELLFCSAPSWFLTIRHYHIWRSSGWSLSEVGGACWCFTWETSAVLKKTWNYTFRLKMFTDFINHGRSWVFSRPLLVLWEKTGVRHFCIGFTFLSRSLRPFLLTGTRLQVKHLHGKHWESCNISNCLVKVMNEWVI